MWSTTLLSPFVQQHQPSLPRHRCRMLMGSEIQQRTLAQQPLRFGTVGKIGGIEHHLASQIPPLPPKSAWSRFRPAFLEKRRKLLEFWLTRVLLHPEIGGREVVREWVLR
ncbi:hypothetical protein CPB83DRAFT_109829 [Crepidotus variabilis]|uniref:PX domain-containing protein n=1 Tax=Crepidotus variabilis TaxID=179855 RepID=A0A9P6ELX2_9AGAR|nr:hypothetical protein CPB83DRAFT_109829 [Crepidotus variabilis]